MLPDYLEAFNLALQRFHRKYPREKWSSDFKESLLNDFSFFSAKIEDAKLNYGDTIRFLNNEIIRGINLTSLLGISEHQRVLKNLIESIENFELTEETIKAVHSSLMDSPLAWETGFKPELVGNYRNIPILGSRRPYFKDKVYAPHFNLEIIMPSYLDIFKSQLSNIENTVFEKHLLTRLAFFHNKFLNEIHPFADGNGRVCRILIGAIMMKHDCPPIFPRIMTLTDQIKYITTIVQCEEERSDKPLIEYFALEMSAYLTGRIEGTV
jgi:Fic family protein